MQDPDPTDCMEEVCGPSGAPAPYTPVHRDDSARDSLSGSHFSLAVLPSINGKVPNQGRLMGTAVRHGIWPLALPTDRDLWIKLPNLPEFQVYL